MRIHSFIKVCITILTIVFAITIGTVPGSTRMQPQVSTSNVTQVRFTCSPTDNWCGQYNKVALARWVQRTNDGKEFKFVEDSHDNKTINLSDASRGIKIQFDFSRMMYGVGVTALTSPTTGVGYSALGDITGVYEISANNSPETCTQQTTAPGAKCNCDLRTLRPLQGAVGMEEVRKKAKDIKNGEKTRLDLAYDPIKIVRGPDGLYVTDHHHGALAWLEANNTMGTCQIQSATISTDPTQFWVDLNTLKLVHLNDKDGKIITAKQLPTSLRALPDDPYRTLAWRVRKGDGFCRALMTVNKEFAEFQWADWLRKRPEFKNPPGPNGKWSDSKRDAAVALAKSTAAEGLGLPGYRGDKPVTPTPCNDDPD